MKRAKHSLSHYKLLTCDMGKLVPIGLIEALPGDTIQHSTSMLIRMSPLLAPVMHPVSVRVHHWFVPIRTMWDDWEDFITGGPNGTGAVTPYPTNAAIITAANAKNSILDYMGVPVDNNIPVGAINTLPVTAYNQIYNEFYRDEDLIAEAAATNIVPRNVAWEKDYFTNARPWSQKGPAITMPIGTSAPVKTGASQVTGVRAAMKMRIASSGAYTTAGNTLGIAGAAGDVGAGGGGPAMSGGNYPENLYADLSAATAADIIDIRRAFALQRYQEARAQYGSRYTEYLRFLGINPQDSRLQRPEYLGGGKQTVAFSEVLRTGNTAAEDATKPIGQMKGHGIAAMRSNRYRYFCQEHGYIMTLLSIRPRSMYTDGLDRTWSRRTKEDYFQKELELIGQQEVYNRELYLKGDATDANVFGYQDRYAEYRHQYSRTAGEFKNILDYWHLARKFTNTPVLNQSFVECDPSKRIFAEQTQHSCWIMASHSIQARRMVGHNTIGRII